MARPVLLLVAILLLAAPAVSTAKDVPCPGCVFRFPADVASPCLTAPRDPPAPAGQPGRRLREDRDGSADLPRGELIAADDGSDENCCAALPFRAGAAGDAASRKRARAEAGTRGGPLAALFESLLVSRPPPA